MNVSLTPELEQMVSQQVASGLYNSASEVVRDALRMFQEREELKRLRYEELRQKILAGAEQIKQGKYKTYASADELMDDIEARAKAELAAERHG